MFGTVEPAGKLFDMSDIMSTQIQLWPDQHIGKIHVN